VKITENEYRELKNEVVLQREILESIRDALDGKEVCDFMMSFGIVRRVCDLTINQHCIYVAVCCVISGGMGGGAF